MKLALLADVHANLEALTACLAHAREQGADAYAFLGDLVGYGADPGPVLDLVRGHVERGAIAVLGNHDAAVLDAAEAATMNPAAEEAVAWTRGRLSPEHRAFLASLPLVARRGDMLFVHASAESPRQWIYVTDPLRAAHALGAADARWVFSGHVHEPILYFASAADRPVAFRPVAGVAIPVPARRRWLAIAGSCGQPRDGNTAACYAMMDDARPALTFHRVPYDWPSAAAKVRAAGLPPRLADRLAHGE
ncbi:metallophosphoesterase family protein [Anaeromyxobacter oryzae]|uniref:Metallophosphoesterase n=1 Tax=Anaeromyxobacter oryzae TaxID=2918170 RepID=A0ABN6MNJ6_9BACT|nr:metallophosphoesterase family protein [Anaeromyxobacter oryzae]BDG02614.1 metallophosphoesterase [Anaeromyxobacter oryzae]